MNFYGAAISAVAAGLIAWFTVILSGTAKVQITHNVVVERAYVQMRADPPGLYPIVDHTKADQSKPDHMIKIRVKNFGKTPAMITDAPMWYVVTSDGRPLPTANLSFPDEVRGNAAFLAVGEDFCFFRRIKSQQFDPEGETFLWVYGYVDYECLGERYRSGWARQYKRLRDNERLYGGKDTEAFRLRENLVLISNDPNNYDRRRE